MLQIMNTIISDDVIEKKFVCDLTTCKGICCVKGDSGAPLEEDEIHLLDAEYEKIKPFLRKEGINAIEKNGKYYVDDEHDTVTQLINGKECAYTLFDEKGIAACGIEKAWEAGAANFRKPISCWLYPVRTKQLKEFEAVNYDVWDICKPALIYGEKHDVPVYVFLKEVLIEKFGKEWYEQLKFYAENK